MNMQHFNGTCNDYNHNVDKKQAEMRQKGVKTPRTKSCHTADWEFRSSNYIQMHIYSIASKCRTTNSQGRHGHTLQRYQL